MVGRAAGDQSCAAYVKPSRGPVQEIRGPCTEGPSVVSTWGPSRYTGKGPPIGANCRLQETPLVLAASQGHVEVVRSRIRVQIRGCPAYSWLHIRPY